MHILDEGAQHLAFVVANRYRHRHGIGSARFATALLMLAGELSVDTLTAVRVARWLYSDGCNRAADRIVRQLDAREQHDWWLMRRLRPDADAAAFLAGSDASRARKRAFIDQVTGNGDSFDDRPGLTYAELKRVGSRL
ncbi:hypothetical protein [Micromonospora arborensis]|uniref:hypothetical protein n=1 Tax=Micromonospora arborensis TaxID=2116518 RepID=UPI00371B3942